MKKIAIIGDNQFDSLAWNLSDTINMLGSQSKIFNFYGTLNKQLINYSVRFSKRIETSLFRHLANKIINYSPDLIIVVFRFAPPDFIDQLKKDTDAKVIFFNCDHLGNFERGYSFISNYDAWFIKDKYIESFVKKKLGINVFYLPEAFNPNIHKANNEIKFGENFDISLVGTLYPYRSKILEQVSENFNISIFGNLPRWMDKKWGKLHLKKYLTGEEKANVFLGSKINLNTLHYGEIYGGNCRLFEIAGCGGFQICDRKEEIRNYFVEDKEIVLFDDIKELKEKIKYYLNNQDKAFEIAKAAKARAYKDHTYEIRLNEVFEKINFRLD